MRNIKFCVLVTINAWCKLILTAAVALCVFCGYSGADSNQPWPQYSNIAPLPGGGIAIDSDGHLDGLGALQINVPVAYTPSLGFFNLSGYAGNYSNGRNEEFGNGSGILGIGFSNAPRFYGSGMQVSRHWDEAKVVNGQLQLFPEKPNFPAISVGVQDALMKEKHMRSLYVVGTSLFSINGRPLYGSLGYGGGRFLNDVFAGLSTPISDSLNLAGEWDGFQFNAGLAWRPGGRKGNITTLAAYNGRAGWLLGIGTAVDLGAPR